MVSHPTKCTSVYLELFERLFYSVCNATGRSKMEMTKTTNKTNIKKLADYINGQPNPELFAAVLLAFAKPHFNDATDTQKEVEVIVR